MEVRIVQECVDRPGRSAACAEADYVRVETWPDPEQDTVTLATIERIVQKSNTEASVPRPRVKTLLRSHPMSPHAALGLATLYAERKKIRVVLSASLVSPAR